jgi:ribosomal protein S18 acetylase RimI-like enzyme
MLLDAVLTAMRERGAEDAFLWVGEANARARRFYEREGWAADGETRVSPVGPRELRYALEL